MLIRNNQPSHLFEAVIKIAQGAHEQDDGLTDL